MTVIKNMVNAIEIREEIINKQKDKIKRRNKQIKNLKGKINELELCQGEIDHFLIKKFGTSNLAELTR